jgi:hypothetical protein
MVVIGMPCVQADTRSFAHSVWGAQCISFLTHPSRPNQQTRGPIHSIPGDHHGVAPTSNDISCQTR